MKYQHVLYSCLWGWLHTWRETWQAKTSQSQCAQQQLHFDLGALQNWFSLISSQCVRDIEQWPDQIVSSHCFRWTSNILLQLLLYHLNDIFACFPEMEHKYGIRCTKNLKQMWHSKSAQQSVIVNDFKIFHSFLHNYYYTANKLTVLSTAFGSVTFPTIIWLYTEQLMTVHIQWL